MKKYVRASKLEDRIGKFDVVIQVFQDLEILSATYKGLYIPEGEVIPGDKNAIISEQVLADYDDFIESIEDLLIDNYNLELTYFNDSDDHSYYYNFLAKDGSGEVILKFRLRLRISNHKAHRNKAQQSHKKDELNSPELLKFTHGKSLIPYAKQIMINNKIYDSYMDAIEDIDDQVNGWVKKMKSRV